MPILFFQKERMNLAVQSEVCQRIAGILKVEAFFFRYIQKYLEWHPIH